MSMTRPIHGRYWFAASSRAPLQLNSVLALSAVVIISMLFLLYSAVIAYRFPTADERGWKKLRCRKAMQSTRTFRSFYRSLLPIELVLSVPFFRVWLHKLMQEHDLTHFWPTSLGDYSYHNVCRGGIAASPVHLVWNWKSEVNVDNSQLPSNDTSQLHRRKPLSFNEFEQSVTTDGIKSVLKAVLLERWLMSFSRIYLHFLVAAVVTLSAYGQECGSDNSESFLSYMLSACNDRNETNFLCAVIATALVTSLVVAVVDQLFVRMLLPYASAACQRGMLSYVRHGCLRILCGYSNTVHSTGLKRKRTLPTNTAGVSEHAISNAISRTEFRENNQIEKHPKISNLTNTNLEVASGNANDFPRNSFGRDSDVSISASVLSTDHYFRREGRSHCDNDLRDLSDEWQFVQGMRTTLLRAARLSALHREVDYVTAEEEASALISITPRDGKEKNDFIRLESAVDQLSVAEARAASLTLSKAVGLNRAKEQNLPLPVKMNITVNNTTLEKRHFWLDEDEKYIQSMNWATAIRSKFILLQMQLYDVTSVGTARDLLYAAHVLNPRLIQYKLERSRSLATRIRHDILEEHDELERDRLLMRWFIIQNLAGYKRLVAERCILLPHRRLREQQMNFALQLIALIMVPLYFTGLLICTFFLTLSLGAFSAARDGNNGRVLILCIAISLYSITQDLLIIQPCRIWFFGVWLPYCVKKDISALVWSLQVRSRSILSRRRYFVKAPGQYKDLVQHFNPACRAARLLPSLPTARLLFSLTDFDLPAAHVLRKPARRSMLSLYQWVPMLGHRTGSPLISDCCDALRDNALKLLTRLKNAIVFCFLSIMRLATHGLLLLPLPGQLACVEGFCCVVINILLLIFCLAAERNSLSLLAIMLACGCSCGVAVFVFKVRDGTRREQCVLDNLSQLRNFYSQKTFTSTSAGDNSSDERWVLESVTNDTAHQQEQKSSNISHKYAATHKKNMMRKRELELAQRRSRQFP